MHFSLRTSLVAAGAAVAALGGAAPAPAATVLTSEPQPTLVAAWNGTVMWSQFDAATGDYRLVKSVDGGAPSPVGIPERPAPFDVDLGTNRSGSTYAVYSRDGDLYRLSVASGIETKLARLSSPRLAERDPTIQRGQIAFVRRNGRFDELRVGGTTRAAKATRLVARKPSIVGAELGVGVVAYVEQAGPLRLVHVVRLRDGADRVVYRAKSGGANYADVTRPSYDAEGGAFVWARTNAGSGTGNRLVRYELASGRFTYGAGSPRWNSTAWAGDELGAVTASSLTGDLDAGTCDEAGRHYCEVAMTGPVEFSLRP
ncbi:MAG TPA: hypothetical protein VGJ32_00500 [Solirubrobacteraceae bacterium]|jgi:hypothetical protein